MAPEVSVITLASSPYLTARHLLSLVPDIVIHEIYVCGPASMLETVEDALRQLRVPRRQVHSENFQL